MTWNFAIDPRKKKRTKKNEHNTKRRRQQQQQQQIKKTWIARESNDIFFSCFEFYNNGSDSKPYRRCRLELTVTLSLVKVYSCRWDCHCSCWNGGWEAPKYFKNKSYPTLMIVWIAIVVVLLVLMPTGTAVVDGDTTGKASTVLLSRRSRPSIRNLLLTRAVFLVRCPVFTKRWRWVAKLRSHQKCPKPDRKKAKEYGPTIRQKTKFYLNPIDLHLNVTEKLEPHIQHPKSETDEAVLLGWNDVKMGNIWPWSDVREDKVKDLVQPIEDHLEFQAPTNWQVMAETAQKRTAFIAGILRRSWRSRKFLTFFRIGSWGVESWQNPTLNPSTHPSGRNRSCRRCLPMQANVATSRLLIRVLWREGKRIEAPVGKSYSYANRRSDVDSFSQFWNRTEW